MTATITTGPDPDTTETTAPEPAGSGAQERAALLWTALRAEPGATTHALAQTVARARDEVAATLQTWLDAGHVNVSQNGRNGAQRWHTTRTAPDSAPGTDTDAAPGTEVDDAVTDTPDHDDDPETATDTDDDTDDTAHDADAEPEDEPEDDPEDEDPDDGDADDEDDDGADAGPSPEARLWEALLAAAGRSTDDLAAAAGLDPVAARRMVAGWRSSDEERLWAALCEHPGASTDELAAVADLDRHRARQMLTRWAKGERPAVAVTEHWHSDPAAPCPAVTRKTRTPGSRTGGGTGAGTGGGSRALSQARVSTGELPRLTTGALSGQVEDYLREHPATDGHSPATIAKALGGRSTGAVANACERLVEHGMTVRVQDKPRRYSLDPAVDSDS